MAFFDDVADSSNDQTPVVPAYDPESPYWNADHPDHKATIEAMKRALSAKAGPEEREFSDLWDQTRLAKKFGDITEMVPRHEGITVDPDDSLTFYRYAEQENIAPDAVTELVRAAHLHEVAGGGVPREADVAELRQRVVADYRMKPAVFDALLAWYIADGQ